MRKAANRTMFDFNKAEEEYVDGDEVVGLGVLGSKEGSGQLRVVANQQKLKLNAKQQKKYKNRLGGLASTAHVSGLSSSLAFTPVQVWERDAGARLHVRLCAPLRRCLLRPPSACARQPVAACARANPVCPPSVRQGIELTNPNAGRGPEVDAQRAGTESYFSERAGFRSLTAQSAVRKQ